MTKRSFLEQVLQIRTYIVSTPSFCFRGPLSVTFADEACPATERDVSESALSTEGRTRVNSRYLRELTLGRFIIKYETLTQLENIGQGNAVSFS